MRPWCSLQVQSGMPHSPQMSGKQAAVNTHTLPCSPPKGLAQCLAYTRCLSLLMQMKVLILKQIIRGLVTPAHSRHFTDVQVVVAGRQSLFILHNFGARSLGAHSMCPGRGTVDSWDSAYGSHSAPSLKGTAQPRSLQTREL
jgi:hypothetical protein